MNQYKLKDPSLVPPTGFPYKQQETGAVIDGKSLFETARLVVKHRVSNELPRATMEEATEDIENQLCMQLGDQWCRNMKTGSWGFKFDFDAVKAGTRTMMALAASKLSGDSPYVSQQVAEQRAESCANCFANKRVGGCISCGLGDMIRALVAESLQPGTTSKDAFLQSCLVCGCLLSKKVWVKEEIILAGLSEKQKEAYNEIPRCWIRDTYAKNSGACQTS